MKIQTDKACDLLSAGRLKTETALLLLKNVDQQDKARIAEEILINCPVNKEEALTIIRETGFNRDIILLVTRIVNLSEKEIREAFETSLETRKILEIISS